MVKIFFDPFILNYFFSGPCAYFKHPSHATSLFSLLYHMASSHDIGSEALIASGLLDSMLTVIQNFANSPDPIMFVTRAVRIIDLITNHNMTVFKKRGGINYFIERLSLEVDHCRTEQPFCLVPENKEFVQDEEDKKEDKTDNINKTDKADKTGDEKAGEEKTGDKHDQTEEMTDDDVLPAETVQTEVSTYQATSTPLKTSIVDMKNPQFPVKSASNMCMPQRSALLKSILNFLKKCIDESGHSSSDQTRHIMDTTLPRSLRHILSNCHYYGPSLFMLVLDVVQTYIAHDPSLLSSVQETGLTDVIMQSILIKDPPAAKDALQRLPNIFITVCMNESGLNRFMEYKPFKKLFRLFLKKEYRVVFLKCRILG